MISGRIRRWCHTASIWVPVFFALVIATVGILSYSRPIIWEYNPAPPKGWFFGVRVIEGGIYAEWPHFGAGYFPFAFFCVPLMAWPAVAFVLWWKSRGTERGFPVITANVPTAKTASVGERQTGSSGTKTVPVDTSL